jgi:acetolactate synthase-1/2/3 large subunit
MIDIYEFIAILNEASQPGDIINPSASGITCQMILQTWKVKKGQRFCTNFVLGEMGAGLPYSIGAALATGKRVIHIEGDGGFQLNIHDLETIKRLNLPIIMFIINNNGYASIRDSQMKNFGRLTGADDTSGLTLPDLFSVAWSYDIQYYELIDLKYMDWLLNKDMCEIGKNPLLVEVNVNPNQQYQHRVKSKMINGKMATDIMDIVD